MACLAWGEHFGYAPAAIEAATATAEPPEKDETRWNKTATKWEEKSREKKKIITLVIAMSSAKNA